MLPVTDRFKRTGHIPNHVLFGSGVEFISAASFEIADYNSAMLVGVGQSDTTSNSVGIFKMRKCILALFFGISFVSVAETIAQDMNSGSAPAIGGAQRFPPGGNNPQLKSCLMAATSDDERAECNQQFGQSGDWRQKFRRPPTGATATPIPEPTEAIQVPESNAEDSVPMY